MKIMLTVGVFVAVTVPAVLFGQMAPVVWTAGVLAATVAIATWVDRPLFD